ncbi:glutathione S-transferase family protein [Altererythrobacter soli]|uniref:Glutathione S-transferase family protein n=1 Tax=Croceibacterium soli TaxID=1739690 RepID=A0A6I4UUU0_9SPHN|nr:glutathione S-transferase family protein [Croceibacterium soli]MXP42692.1 glutathione S-transferase family protein [Croceibacterium soli]
MKIYGFPLSPFVRKVAVAASEKGLDYEWEPSNPSQPTEEFARISPFKKIPALSDGDFCLADSTAIVTYLDAQYPEPPLLPAEPRSRGRSVWFDEVIDTVLIPAAAPIVLNRFLRPKIFGTEGDETAAAAAEEAVLRPLDYLEGELREDGWLDGTFSVGDIGLASSIKTLSYAGWTLDTARHPKIAAWFERTAARPAWRKVAEEEATVLASLGG